MGSQLTPLVDLESRKVSGETKGGIRTKMQECFSVSLFAAFVLVTCIKQPWGCQRSVSHTFQIPSPQPILVIVQNLFLMDLLSQSQATIKSLTIGPAR